MLLGHPLHRPSILDGSGADCGIETPNQRLLRGWSSTTFHPAGSRKTSSPRSRPLPGASRIESLTLRSKPDRHGSNRTLVPRHRNRTSSRGATNSGMAAGRVDSRGKRQLGRRRKNGTCVRRVNGRLDGTRKRVRSRGHLNRRRRRNRTDPLAGRRRDRRRRLLALRSATVYHDGDVRTKNRPRGDRPPHGTAGHPCGQTKIVTKR
jgi:hypothetical protein